MFYLFKSIGRFRRKDIFDFRRLCSKNKSELPPWKVIFYGTDVISEVTLKALNNNRTLKNECKVVESLEVVCIKSNCAVRRYATLNDLTIHTWPFNIPLGIYDVGIVVSFGYMIPSSSILACKYNENLVQMLDSSGILNAHPSLLPRWRGAAPIFHTILNGDQKTGVTITQVSPNKFDVGNILMQEEYIVPERCTTKLLREDLSKLAANMVLKTLQRLPYYIEVSYPQPTKGKTLARKIKPQNCTINWTEESSACIDRKFRAFDGFFDLHATWKGSLKVTIMDIVSPQEVKDAKIPDLVKNPVLPGSCYFHKKRKILFVKCKEDWIGIKSIRVPKRGIITALDFYNGFVTKEEPEGRYFI